MVELPREDCDTCYGRYPYDMMNLLPYGWDEQKLSVCDHCKVRTVEELIAWHKQ